MRADICEPNDEEAIARFHTVLEELGAEICDQGWGLGVDMRIVTIAERELRIFQDAWSLDIDGPDDVVATIVQRMRA